MDDKELDELTKETLNALEDVETAYTAQALLDLIDKYKVLQEQLKTAWEEGWKKGYADRVAEEAAGYKPYEK